MPANQKINHAPSSKPGNVRLQASFGGISPKMLGKHRLSGVPCAAAMMAGMVVMMAMAMAIEVGGGGFLGNGLGFGEK